MRDRILRAAIVTFIAVAFLFTGWYLLRTVPGAVVRKAVGKTEKTYDIESLVTQIRELSRLETASMRVMHVSTIEQSYGVVPDKLGGDALTFMSIGDVIAGIDLSQVTREDVTISPDGVITLELPPPMILVTRLDNAQSRVLNRDTGWLRRADPGLESRARLAGEIAIRREAMNKGILTLASNNAQSKLAAFLNALGFDRVKFEQKALPPGSS
jgi:hypothetical protein